jgi:thiol-disulfide isomerase/thioredoxin
MHRRTQLAGLLLLILTLALLTGCATGDANPPASKLPEGVGAFPGQTAPDFTLTTFSGHDVTLSQLKGKPVFLNIWASWCPPCKSEMPDLQRMSRQYEDKVLVYGINSTTEDTRDKAEEFVLNMRLTFPNLIDANGQVKRDYRILSMPVSLTIDANGKVVDRHEGQLTPGKMKEMFDHLLPQSK